MTDPQGNEKDLTLFAVVSLVLARRRMIFGLAGACAVLGLVTSLLSTRQYVSTATFVPESPGGAPTDLAAAARQFGLGLPDTRGGWVPGLYVEVLRSNDILGSIAADSFSVPELGGGRRAVLDLFRVSGGSPQQRVERATRLLGRKVVSVSESRTLGLVNVEVKTPWPSLSQAIAMELVSRINDFNLHTRQSRAAAELEFLDSRTSEAERTLREAEDRLELFLQRNHSVSDAPQLAFERDRLAREVALDQQLYMNLVQRREDARLNKVRNTPVITVVEAPRVPVIGEPRGTVFRTLLGGLAGGLLGLGIALLSRRMARLRGQGNADVEELVRTIDDATPRLVARMVRRWSHALR